jgi:hypothetical protein
MFISRIALRFLILDIVTNKGNNNNNNDNNSNKGLIKYD